MPRKVPLPKAPPKDRKASGHRIPRNGRHRIPSSVDPPEAANLLIHQRMFVNHLFGEAHFDPTKAAELTGFANPVQASYVLMRNPGIKAAIRAKLDRGGMSADELVARETEVARGDITRIMTRGPRGWYVDLDKVHREGLGHLIKKIKPTKWGLSAELYPADAARDRLMRVRGLYNDRMTVVHQMDLTKLPPTPQAMEILGRYASGEISADDFHASVRALGHDLSVPATVIEGEGMVHEVVEERDLEE